MNSKIHKASAGFFIRLLAKGIDYILFGLILSFFSMLFIIFFIEAIIQILIVQSIVAILLTLFFEGAFAATPGKMILGLVIVNDDAKKIDISKALLRFIGKIVNAVVLGFGYLLIFFTPEKQGLHDIIAKTYVVYKKKLK